MSKTFKSNALAAILETASDLHEAGLMPKRTMRRFHALWTPPDKKAIRLTSRTNQAVLARYLSLTPSLVSQRKRREWSSSGASARLKFTKHGGVVKTGTAFGPL